MSGRYFGELSDVIRTLGVELQDKAKMGLYEQHAVISWLAAAVRSEGEIQRKVSFLGVELVLLL